MSNPRLEEIVVVTMRQHQNTLNDSLFFSGVGVHSGRLCRMALHPAEPGSGLAFHRSDRTDAPITQALWANAREGALTTRLALGPRASVGAIEHILAALYALNVDNAVIEIEGPEAPILDGSARAFVEGLMGVGLRPQGRAPRKIVVLKPVRVAHGLSFAQLSPGGPELALETEIAFDHPAIGRQSAALALTPASFATEIADARTFGFVGEAESLWARGLALGAGLDNTLAFDAAGPINPGGLRFANECARHKLLDAIGDLALCGGRLCGSYRSYRGGHAINLLALKALFADPDAYRIIEEQPASPRSKTRFPHVENALDRL